MVVPVAELLEELDATELDDLELDAGVLDATDVEDLELDDGALDATEDLELDDEDLLDATDDLELELTTDEATLDEVPPVVTASKRHCVLHQFLSMVPDCAKPV